MPPIIMPFIGIMPMPFIGIMPFIIGIPLIIGPFIIGPFIIGIWFMAFMVSSIGGRQKLDPSLVEPQRRRERECLFVCRNGRTSGLFFRGHLAVAAAPYAMRSSHSSASIVPASRSHGWSCGPGTTR